MKKMCQYISALLEVLRYILLWSTTNQEQRAHFCDVLGRVTYKTQSWGLDRKRKHLNSNQITTAQVSN